MRRFIPLAIFFLSALAASAVEVPYHSSMGDDNAGWKIVNVVEGTPTFEKTTSVSGTNEDAGLMYNHVKDEAGVYASVDDWAISPGVELQAGVCYQIAYYAKPMSMATYSESGWYVQYDLRVGKGDTPEALSAGTQIWDYNSATNSNWGKGYGGGRSFVRVVNLFTPTETGTYYFGFHFYAAGYNNDAAILTLTGFDVEDFLSAVTPKYPQDFYSMYFKVGEDRKLEVELNWRLDTLDSNGNLLPEEITYKEVRVYRDGVLAATVPGAPSSWTDKAEYGLTAGQPAYSVEAVLSNGKSAKTTDTKPDNWVGPVATNQLPWTMKISDVVFKKDYLSVQGSTEGASTSGWTKSSSYLKYTPTKNKPDDSYLILPPFEATATGYYELQSKVNFTNTAHLADGLEIYLAKQNPTTAASYTNKVGTISPEKTGEAQFYNTFYIEEPGTYTLAIRRYRENATETNDIRITALSILKGALSTLPITDLKGEVVNENAVLTWTNPTKTNIGTDLDKITKIEVIRYNNLSDTVVAATLTDGLVPGQESTYTDVPEKPWLYNYFLKIYLDDAVPSQMPMIAFAENEWIGTKEQTLPYAYDKTFDNGEEGKEYDYSVEPIKKLWIMEKGDCTSTSTLGLYSSGFQLSITKNRTMAYRIIAPPIKLKKGYYKVGLRMKGGYADMNLNAGYMTHNDAARNVKNKVQFATGAYSTTERELTPVVVKVDEEGLMDFVISIDGSTPASGSTGTLYISRIAFEVMPIIPTAATNLRVEAAADKSLSATIKWINPSTSNVAGVAPEITKVVVYRNGESIATITEGMVAGEAAEYVDSEIPTAGIYTYKIEVFTTDGSNAEAVATSPWIGLGKDLPYESTDFTEWTVPTGSAWEAGTTRLDYDNPEFDTNDWAFSPRFNLEEGKYYDIEFTAWVGLGMDATDLEVFVGNDVNEEAMSVSLGRITVEDQTESSATPQMFFMHAVAGGPTTFAASDYISVASGIGVIGINAPIGGTLHIKNFSVKESPVVGVGTIAADRGALNFNGNELCFASPADKVIVADLTGKIIRIETNVNSVDLSNLAKGVYIVSVNINGRTIPVKISK